MTEHEFWIGFWGDDPRPVDAGWPSKFPYWCSGSTAGDFITPKYTLCAAVRAATRDEAVAMVKVGWPEYVERFVEERAYAPSDRFPVPKWWDLQNWTFRTEKND